MRGKFFIAMKVRRLPSRNFARFPRSRKEFHGASYDFVSLFIHLYYSVASLFLLPHFPIMFRMALYSAPLSFFFSGKCARIDRQPIHSFVRKNYFLPTIRYFHEAFKQLISYVIMIGMAKYINLSCHLLY